MALRNPINGRAATGGNGGTSLPDWRESQAYASYQQRRHALEDALPGVRRDLLTATRAETAAREALEDAESSARLGDAPPETVADARAHLTEASDRVTALSHRLATDRRALEQLETAVAPAITAARQDCARAYRAAYAAQLRAFAAALEAAVQANTALRDLYAQAAQLFPIEWNITDNGPDDRTYSAPDVPLAAGIVPQEWPDLLPMRSTTRTYTLEAGPYVTERTHELKGKDRGGTDEPRTVHVVEQRPAQQQTVTETATTRYSEWRLEAAQVLKRLEE